MHLTLLTMALLLLPHTLPAQWNIDKPADTIAGKLTGEIFGRPFNLGSAELSKITLTISSKEKMGNWPESKLIIFLKDDPAKTEWLVKPGDEGSNPGVHMKFGREGTKFGGTLMFSGEYSMRLKILSRTKEKVTFAIHVSMPDYKKSYLIGEFDAVVKS